MGVFGVLVIALIGGILGGLLIVFYPEVSAWIARRRGQLRDWRD